MKLNVRNETLGVFDSLPQCFSARVLNQYINKKYHITLPPAQINNELHRLRQSGLIKKNAPMKDGKESRKYTKEWSYLNDWFRNATKHLEVKE